MTLAEPLPRPPVGLLTNQWGKWCLIIGCWSWLAFFFATKDYFGRRSYDMEANWTKALWWKAMEWYAWALLSVVVFWVCRTFYNPRKSWSAYIGIHILTGTVISIAHVGICTVGAIIESKFIESGYSPAYLFRLVFINHFHFDWLVYAAIVSVWHAMDSYRRFRDREVQAVALEARLARTQLQVLKTQLQPHFLFNTLHSISALNHEDPKGANRMLARLSSLLRLTLEQDSAQEVSLSKELEFLRHYLEIEQVRLGERLTVQMEIAPDTFDASVPNLLLQPIVENAIRHAISPFAAPGSICITSKKEKGGLYLVVKDSGPGLAGKPSQLGVGLTNTHERLRQLYGENASLDLSNGEGAGLNVTICLPYKVHASVTEASVCEVHA